MARLRSKIKKVMMALVIQKNEIYLLDVRQGWSTRMGKPVNKFILSKRVSKEEWNKNHPQKQIKAEYKNDVVLETWKELEILLYLVDRLKGGEENG